MAEAKVEVMENVSFQDMTELILRAKAKNFNKNCNAWAMDIWDALEGGDYDKGHKAAKAMQAELRYGDLIDFYNENHKILADMAAGGFSEGSDANFIRNIKACDDFCQEMGKLTTLFENVSRMVVCLLSGGLEGGFKMSLLKLLFEFGGVDGSLKYEIKNSFSQFEEFAGFLKTFSFNINKVGPASETNYGARVDVLHDMLDKKMESKYPVLYSYVDPFNKHNVNGYLANMKTVDSWTAMYKDCMKNELKVVEAATLCDEYLDMANGLCQMKNKPTDDVILGICNFLMKLQEALKIPRDIYLKFKNNVDENPYWIMKYEGAVASVKSNYGLGNSDPKESGTDYYKTYRKMSETLRKIVSQRLLEQ